MKRPDRAALAVNEGLRFARWAATFRRGALRSAPALPLGLALLLGSAAGCGRHPAKLSGEVTLDGKPLPTGVISLSPARSGPSAYGEITPDGRFELKTGSEKGLEPGEYVITVAANAAGSDEPIPEMGGPPPVRPLITPPKYADVSTSPLRITVKPGRQKLDIELSSGAESESESEPQP